ncbi:hypothetical protein TWF225_002453 [Orbilia oligospora]|uniref:Uncharacterized protein n=1 Tax=Orbilia oligospora TaxID=2813651 RepID=A0A7C8KG03_ORBOL|nr:hypothetical protein TWF751_008525 [Orbilia oligospora]KAF3189944.1 hypothetical protein TWF225_002453 [Orbilia oligospora]KAF3266313.1 hypothetical protein TWF217_001981 [Orbilia oligospora]KAF3268562.1 hypothetical protein TWF128_006958 [Orbilia oligospora]KAF3297029.1 hypothetical protein TWF132_008401 [Orbilia oligospora]
MSKSKDSKSTTTSGIQTLESGNRVIPSSTRADGTTRPERRVKPGFTPAEDVVKYHNRTAEAWRNRGSGGVPGATDVVGEGNKAGGAGKKKRRRAKKGGAAGADGEGKGEDEGEEGEEGAEEGGEAATPAAATTTSEPAKAEGEAAVSEDVEKKAKGLHKKIRQAQELKSRKEKGETLLPEQLDKALRLGELIRDLEKLGVKYEG